MGNQDDLERIPSRTWSPTDAESSISERFRRQAEASPDAIAIVGERRSFTYAELSALADSYAAALGERLVRMPVARTPGPRRPPIAGLLLGHGPPVVAAAL